MAGTITHYWTGSVLTVTSDSGTSSADLSGATGPRGPQGRPGVIYDSDGDLYLGDIASASDIDRLETRVDALEDRTEVNPEYVSTKIAAELDNYYDKAEIDSKMKNVNVDLTGYATEAYVQDYVRNNASGGSANVDLSAYATKAYVNNAVANVEADVDLTDYPTFDDMSAAIAQAQLGGSGDGSGVDLSGFATKTYVNDLADGTSIEFRNGHISTAFGGNVIGHEGGEELGGGTPLIVTQNADDQFVFHFNGITDATSPFYDVSVIINDELFVVNKVPQNEMIEVFGNSYFSAISVVPDGGSFVKLYLWVNDNTLGWTSNTLLTAQFRNGQVNVYDPIDANALPVDNTTIVVKNKKIALAQDYATYEYVDAAIANAELSGGGEGGTVNVDLSNYYTKSQVDNLVANVSVDLSNYYTKAQTEAYVLEQKLAIEAWVNQKFAAIGTSEGVEY